jgi:hypothetical protein
MQHRAKQGVGEGGLFLFFGLFRDVNVANITSMTSGRIAYLTGSPPIHVLFDWLLRLRRTRKDPSTQVWPEYQEGVPPTSSSRALSCQISRKAEPWAYDGLLPRRPGRW